MGRGAHGPDGLGGSLLDGSPMGSGPDGEGGEGSDDEEDYLMGTRGLLAVAFFWVSGGIYGNEALVASAPPSIMFFFIGVVGMATYGLPLAVLTAEMGAAWPLDGGMAAWVELGCGSVVGGHNAWWIIASFWFDAAIYPVLAGEYMAKWMCPNAQICDGLEYIECAKNAGSDFTVAGSLVPGWPKNVATIRRCDWIESGCGVKPAVGTSSVKGFIPQHQAGACVARLGIGADSTPCDFTWAQTKIYCSFIVAFCTCIKMAGRDVLEKFSGALGILTLIPSLVFVFWGISYMKPSHWTPGTEQPTCEAFTAALKASQGANVISDIRSAQLGHPDGVSHTTITFVKSYYNYTAPAFVPSKEFYDSKQGFWSNASIPALAHAGGCGPPAEYSKLISYMMWLYAGFYSLGSLAGELESPKTAYTQALVILVPFVLAINTLPLSVALTVDPFRDNFTPGHFTEVAVALCGNWMAWCFFLGAEVSLYGLYNSTSLTAECTMPPYFEKYMGTTFILDPDNPRDKKSWGGWKGWMLDTATTGTGRFYILFNALVCGILVWLPFNFLIEFTMLLMGIMTFPFLYAFLRLRIVQPETERPFEVPGGFVGAVLTCIPPLCVTTADIIFNILDGNSPTKFGCSEIKYFNVIGLMGVILLGVLAQVLYAYFGPKEVVGMADIQKRKEAPTALSNLGGPAPAQLVV